MSEKTTVARLLNFTTPLNEEELTKLEDYCQGIGFGTLVKGRQFHLQLDKKPRVISDEFIEKIDLICKFLMKELKRPYDGDCYEVDY